MNVINHHTLTEKISELIQKSEFHPDCNAITEKALSCLRKKYVTDFESNCEVILSLENIGQICVKSGNGGYKVAVIGDIADCQAILLEYQISTSEINGLLIDSLFRFCSSMPVYLMKEIETDPVKKSFSDAKEYVQINSHINWHNATLDFNGVFPLKVISGEGTTIVTILEIGNQLIENLKKTETSNSSESKQNIINIKILKFDARELGKLRVKYCGNEGPKKTEIQQCLENQFIKLTDYFNQNHKETYWQNCVVDIVNDTTIYRIDIGHKKKKKILVITYDGQPEITVNRA